MLYLWMILSDISRHLNCQKADLLYNNEAYCQAAISGDTNFKLVAVTWLKDSTPGVSTTDAILG